MPPVAAPHSPAGKGQLGERLVRTAVEHIERDGMTVGLEHVSLERIITESGVSRASAYRAFPNKSDFLKEVLAAVVRSTHLEAESPEQVEDLLGLIAARLPDFRSARVRRDLAVEALRRSAQADFDRVATSTSWRTYLALRATCRGLPDGDLQTQIVTLLRETEDRFTAQRAEVYGRLATALGYRLIPPLQPPDGFTMMAEAAGALMTGLVVRSMTPPAATPPRTFRGAAFGSSEEAEWSWVAHHIVGLVLAHIEPDPDVTWTEAHLADAMAAVHEMINASAEINAALAQGSRSGTS